MKVNLVRRWGPHRAGKLVEVSDSQGAWLVQHNYGEAADMAAPAQPAAAEGAHGADPLAGGDATRLRPRVGRPKRDERVNYAAQAAGSSPTYRAGLDADARARQGEAGRPAVESGDADAAESQPAESKKPARRRAARSES